MGPGARRGFGRKLQKKNGNLGHLFLFARLVRGSREGRERCDYETRFWRLQNSKFVNSSAATQRQAPATLEPTPMLGSAVPMVALPGADGSALESY